jgi:hypothetical protein
MQEFLDHPAVQAALAPFLVAFVLAWALRPAKLSGLAVVAGFAVAVAMIAGVDLAPLTTTRKIFLVVLASPLLGIVIDLLVKSGASAAASAALVLGGVTPWVFLNVLRQQEGAAPWMTGFGLALFSAWLAGSLVALRGDPARIGASAVALGLGTGIAAVLGASASFGQYGIALAASGGAFLLVVLMTASTTAAGSVLAMPAAAIGALFAGGTLLLASLPWTALPALALVPLAARLPIPAAGPAWMKIVFPVVYAAIPAGTACALAWQATRAGA